MIYLYSALMLHKAGKEINEGNLKRVVESAGVNVDDGRVKALVAALHDVNIDEVIKQASAAQVAVAPAVQVSEKKEVKEEKSEADKKKEEEQASAGLSSLFG